MVDKLGPAHPSSWEQRGQRRQGSEHRSAVPDREGPACTRRAPLWQGISTNQRRTMPSVVGARQGEARREVIPSSR